MVWLKIIKSGAIACTLEWFILLSKKIIIIKLVSGNPFRIYYTSKEIGLNVNFTLCVFLLFYQQQKLTEIY